MTTVVSILMSDIIPLQDRGVWQGLLNIIYAVGASSGAPLGGILADFVGWRWAFLGQAPLCLLAFVAVVFLLKLPTTEQKDWRTNLGRIDFLGAFVLVSAVFGLIFGLDRGSNESWSLPISYGPLIASVFLFTIFVLVEKSVAAEPFAPGHIIFERSLFSLYLCNFFSFCGWLATLYYIPLFFQAVDGLGATGAAVRLIPAILACVSGSLFGGVVMKKTGKFYWLTVIAYAMLTIGAVVVLCFIGLVANSTYGIAVGMTFGGFGIGIGVTSTLIGLSMSFPLSSTSFANPRSRKCRT
jgi:predicted MFS family arabinose efflux permease